MAQFSRMEVLNAIYDTGIVPVFYNADLEVARAIVDACADGGAKVVEFTNRGDFAYQVFAELVKYCKTERPDVIMGVGSVCDGPTAALDDHLDEHAYIVRSLHELVHWTGHKSRCDRKFGEVFGNEAYAFEELVAELGAALLGSACSLTMNIENHASYLASWKAGLKDDPTAIQRALSAASKAVKFLLERSVLSAAA